MARQPKTEKDEWELRFQKSRTQLQVHQKAKEPSGISVLILYLHVTTSAAAMDF